MHCEQCHRPLAHAEDICPVCAVELSQSTEAIPDLSGTVGRHQCPGCHGKFDYCGTAWHPPHARWYVPQTAKTVCPLCAVELQWKRLQEPPQLSGALQGIALGLAWSLWSTIPPALNQWIKAQLGSWFVILTPLALFARYSTQAKARVTLCWQPTRIPHAENLKCWGSSLCWC